MNTDKSVDESWKDSADKEKKIIGERTDDGREAPKLHVNEPIKQPETDDQNMAKSPDTKDTAQPPEGFEVNFVNYITSLGFQSLIFMGEIPNPVTNEQEKNLDQAKFLIDTLIMMREKTKGNLTEQEDNLLNASVYELQMKYLDCVKSENSNDTKEST